MQTSRPEINKDFKDDIEFTVEWDILAKAKPIDQNPPECPNCGFVSDETTCKYCGAQTTPGTFTDGVAVYKTKKGSTEGKIISTRVYCIDISGSMQGERIKYVQQEILKELGQFVRTNPEDKVCLITFESDCHIIGDGTKDITVGCECSFEKIIEIASKNQELLPIQQSIGKLREKIGNIECVGRTASVSALALATTYASFTGGEVFFYTDGMRNKGLPSVGNIEKIIKQAKAIPEREVFIHIYFFSNCQAFITEYSDCSTQTKGDIKPIHLGKEKKGSEATMKRVCVAYDLVVTSTMSDAIKALTGKQEIPKVANNENLILRFQVPANSPARGYDGRDIHAQCKVEYKDAYGNILKAYINGKSKVVNTCSTEDVQLVVSNKLNQIACLIEDGKSAEARQVLSDLMKMEFRISNDSGNFFRNAFSELMSYLDHVDQDSARKDDVVALLNYMKSARKDGIKI